MLVMDFPKEDFMENKEEEDQNNVDSEAEEALSLCDLPLTNRGEEEEDNWAGNLQSKQENNLGRISSDHQDLFEFFNDLNSEMNSVAEDIIFCGKLIPVYRSSSSSSSSPSPSPSLPLSENHKSHKTSIKKQGVGFIDFSKNSFSHRRLDSLNEFQNLNKSNVKGYRKLQKISSSKMTRTASVKTEKDQIPVRNVSMNSSSFTAVKPRWHFLLFGLMKTPPEMELRDIRNRQNKRNPSPLFPVIDGEQTSTVKKDGGKSSWSVFRALGCRGANAVVTASLGCIPHV